MITAFVHWPYLVASRQQGRIDTLLKVELHHSLLIVDSVNLAGLCAGKVRLMIDFR